jgi:hypothetical protein
MTRHTLYSKKYIMGTLINLSGTLLMYEQRGRLSRWMRATYHRIDGSKWRAHKSNRQQVKQLRVWHMGEFKRVK